MRSRLRYWLVDERGHDLIEYMLLGTFIAIVGWLGIQVLGFEMGNSYQSWDSSTQIIWEVLPPVTTP